MVSLKDYSDRLLIRALKSVERDLKNASAEDKDLVGKELEERKSLRKQQAADQKQMFDEAVRRKLVAPPAPKQDEPKPKE